MASEVIVRGINGEFIASVTLEVGSTARIEDVKTVVEKATCIPGHEMRFLFGNEEVEEGTSVDGMVDLTLVRCPDPERDEWLAKTSWNEFQCRRMPERFRTDREIVATALRHTGKWFHHFDAKFRSDRELMLQAVRFSIHAFEAASPELRADPEVVLNATLHCNRALWLTAPELLEKIRQDFFFHEPQESKLRKQFNEDEIKLIELLLLRQLRPKGKGNGVKGRNDCQAVLEDMLRARVAQNYGRA